MLELKLRPMLVPHLDCFKGTKGHDELCLKNKFLRYSMNREVELDI